MCPAGHGSRGLRARGAVAAPHSPNPVAPQLLHPGHPTDRAHGYVQWWWVAARWWPCPLLETQGLYPMGTARGGRGEDPEVFPVGKRGGRAAWISGV